MNLFKGLEKFGLKTEGTEICLKKKKGPMHQQSRERQKKKYLLRNHFC